MVRSIVSSFSSTMLLSAMMRSQVVGQPEQDVEIEIDGPPPGMLLGDPGRFLGGGPVIMGGRPGAVPRKSAQAMMGTMMRGGPGNDDNDDMVMGGPLDEMKALGGQHMRGGPPGLIEIDGPLGHGVPLEEMMEQLGGQDMHGGPPGVIEIDGPPGRGGSLGEMMELGGPHMHGGPPGLIEIDGPPGRGGSLGEMMELGGQHMRGGPPGLIEIDGPPGRGVPLEEMMEQLGGQDMHGGLPGVIEIDGPPGRGGSLGEMMELGGQHMHGGPPGLIEIDGPPIGRGSPGSMIEIDGPPQGGGGPGQMMMFGGPSMMEGSPGSMIEIDGGPDDSEEGGEMIIGGPQMPAINGPGGGGAEVVIEQDGDGPPQIVSESGNPALFHDLLPGPLPGQHGPPHSQPFGAAPDAMVLNMLKDMGSEFNSKVLPKVQSKADTSREPGSCKGDSVKHCRGATSQIHCLGKHSNDISDKCRQDIGKSVPFTCSKSIDRYCDLLDNSILKCLWDQKQKLNAECLDAVTATRRIPQSMIAQSKRVSSKKIAKATVQNSKRGAAAAQSVNVFPSPTDGQSEWSFWKSLFGKQSKTPAV